MAPDYVEVRIGHSTEPRNCDDCGAPISAGDRFERIHGRWHGHAHTYKVCIACAGILFWRGQRHDRDPVGATIGRPTPDPASRPEQRVVPWEALQPVRP